MLDEAVTSGRKLVRLLVTFNLLLPSLTSTAPRLTGRPSGLIAHRTSVKYSGPGSVVSYWSVLNFWRFPSACRPTARRRPSARSLASVVVGAALSGYRDILRSSPFQEVLGALPPIPIVRMHRKEDSALLDPHLIALGLVLGNPHANQSARDPAYCTAYAHPSQGGHEGTGGEKGAQTRYRQSANAHQPSQGAAQRRTRSGACGCALGSLGAFLVSEVLGDYLFRE